MSYTTNFIHALRTRQIPELQCPVQHRQLVAALAFAIQPLEGLGARRKSPPRRTLTGMTLGRQPEA